MGIPVCPFNLFYLDHVYVIGGVNQLGGLLSLPGRVIRQPGRNLPCKRLQADRLCARVRKTSPRNPEVVRLYVNADYFLTTARRIASPTKGFPSPRKG